MLSFAAILVASTVAAEPVRLFVSADGFRADVERMIREEVKDIVFTSSSTADVHLSMRAGDGLIFIAVRGPEGYMGERTLPASDGREPALRIATLLVSRAIESMRSLDEPMGMPPLAGDVRVGASAATFIAWWESPFSPTVGLGGTAGIDAGAFRIGVFAAQLGAVCCERSITRIAGDASELIVLADGAFTFLQQGPFRMRVRLGGGIDWVRLDATPVVMFGRGATTRVSKVVPVGRFGGSFDVEIVRDRVWFGAGAGGLVRSAVGVTNLDGQSLSSGTLVPWVEVAVGAHLL